MRDSARSVERLQLRQVEGLAAVAREEWDQLVPDDNPFLRYDFLAGLEQHKCLAGHGWLPCHLLLGHGDKHDNSNNNNNKLLGAIPLYLKDNSYGEFVFDWAWADAYERAGGQYYPKLVSAIPFSPVCGPRLLIHPDYSDKARIKEALLKASLHVAGVNKLSSLHCLFVDEHDLAAFPEQDFLLRKTIQFHWHNRNYRDFQDFLDNMSSRKRKQIRRERRRVQEQNIQIEVLPGKAISEAQWQAFYQFYCATFYRRWGEPRLTLDFFLSLSDTLPEQTLLILASHERRYVAGAFAMLGERTLFGRHWGCSRQFNNLHFELCYYQTIEFCIRHGLQRLDAGVQGEHKLQRGFEPVGVGSAHWIGHAPFRAAIADYLRRETAEIDRHIAMLREHLPYKLSNANGPNTNGPNTNELKANERSG